jgi:predicted glutamine amidotransferase
LCRLFAWHSASPLNVKEALGSDFDTYTDLSSLHRDGWGMAYNAGDSLELIRDSAAANKSKIYEDATSNVKTENAIVHLRWATEEISVCIPNTHPFIKQGPKGPVSFCHNGGVARGDALSSLIDPDLMAELDGDTDSEQYFAAFLTQLRLHNNDIVAAYCELVKNLDPIRYTSINALIMTEDELVIVCQHKPENRSPELEADYYDLFWKTENGTTTAWSSGVRAADKDVNELKNGTLLHINSKTGEVKVHEIR